MKGVQINIKKTKQMTNMNKCVQYENTFTVLFSLMSTADSGKVHAEEAVFQ